MDIKAEIRWLMILCQIEQTRDEARNLAAWLAIPDYLRRKRK